MEKQTVQDLVNVRGHDQMPVDSDEIVLSNFSSEYILKVEALENVSVDYGIVHEDFSDDFKEVPSRDDLKYHIDDVRFSEGMDEWIHRRDVRLTYCGEVYTQEYLADSDEWYYIERGRAEGEYVYYENTDYCEDIHENVHQDDSHYCEDTDRCYYHEEEMPSNGYDEDCINGYHSSPPPKDLSDGAQYKIGFEIEKNSFNGCVDTGDEVGNYSLFKGFEKDSSCGVEAITHILPLSGVRSKRRKRVFDMMDQAREIIEEEASKTCGGHITISVKTLNAEDFLDKIRSNLSIFYALYRFRLTNSYCDKNKPLKKEFYAGGHSAVELKRNINAIEIRLPNRVVNLKQLKLRYDLCYIIVRHTMEGGRYLDLLKKAKPVIEKMYKGREEMVEHIMFLAKQFRVYLIAEEVHDSIEEFINGTNNEEE